jgi:autotransporter-associated beta strand protein
LYKNKDQVTGKTTPNLTIMKDALSLCLISVSSLLWFMVALSAEAQVVQVKADNATALGTGSSWVSGTAPGSGDIGEWNSVATVAGDTLSSLGGPFSLGELLILNTVAGPVNISDGVAADVLTLNGASGTGTGIDLSRSSQNLALGTALALGANQIWNIGSGNSLTLAGSNGIAFHTNILTVKGLGTLNVNYDNVHGTASSSSTGAGLVLTNGGTVCINIQTLVNLLGVTAYQNFLGASTALTMGGGSVFSAFAVTDGGDSEQIFSRLSLAPGTSLFQLPLRQANSGISVGFSALSREGGSMADFGAAMLTSGGASFGGLGSTYALPGSTVNGFATMGANDWALPLGGTTVMGTATYTVNVFTNPTANVAVTASEAPAAFTVNSLCFNSAAAVTLTLSGVNTVTSGGLLVDATNGSSGITITGGTLTSGNTNADGTHDLIFINNTASSGNIVINSVIADNGANSVGLTVGSTSVALPSGSVQLGAANTFSGTTLVTAGTLQLNNSLALQNATCNPSQAGTLSFGSLTAATFAGLAGSGILPLPANFTLTVGNNNASSSFAGTLSGAGAKLTKIGTGALTLNGASSFSGQTTVSNGTVALGAGGSLAGPVWVGPGANLDVSAAGNYFLAQTVAGVGGINGNLTLTNGGVLSPSTTSGTLTLSNNLSLGGGVCAFNLDAGLGQNGKIAVLGNLTLSAGIIQLVITNGTLTNGTYRLITCSGAPAGSVNSLSVAGLNQPGQVAALSVGAAELDVVVTNYASQTLVWKGDGLGAGVWNENGDVDWFDNPTASVFQNGDSATFDNTSTNQAVLLAGIVSPLFVVVNSTNNYSFGGTGSLGGSAALTNSGSGTLTILTANENTGGTTISGGTVQVGNGVVTGSLGSGAVVDNAALVFDLPAGSQSLGAVTGTGTLLVEGAGTVLVNGTNTLAGTTTIASGNLKQGRPNVLPNGSSAGNLVVNGTLDLGGENGTINELSGGGMIDSTLAGTPVLTITGGGIFGGVMQNTAGALGIAVAGSGRVLQLSGTNTYTGGTSVNAGTLQLGGASGMASGNVNVASAATLDLNGFSATINGLSGSGTVDNTAAGTPTLTIGAVGGNGTFSGVIQNTAGTLSLLKVGTGTEVLSGFNSYSGSTTISNGVLQINTGGVINGGAVNVASPGTLEYPDAKLVISGGALTASQASNVGNNTAGLLVSSGNATFNGGVTTDPVSTFNLIQVSGGVLSASSLVLGEDGIPISSQPTAGSTIGGFYLHGGTVNISGNMILGPTGAADITTNMVSSTSALLASGSLTVDGALTIGLNNASRWSVVDVDGATVMVAGSVLVGGPLAGCAELLVRAGTATVGKIGLGQAGNTETVVVDLTGGTLYVGSGGIVQLTTGPTASTTLAGGTLGATADWSSLLPMTLTGSPTVRAADASSVAHGITLSGVLSGTGSITKTGAGMLTLTGTNTYSGTTMISAGALMANSSSSTGTNTVTVASGGTLGGSGMVPGNVVVNSGGRTLPGGTNGNPVGETTFLGGTLTYNAGAEADFNLTGTYNSGNDLLVGGKGIITTNGLKVGIVMSSGAAPDTRADYVLMTNTYGGITGNFTNFPAWLGTGGAPANATNFSILTWSNFVTLHYSPIVITALSATPNPATHNQIVNFTVSAATAAGDAITNVSVNASAIGGSSAVPLVQSNAVASYTNNVSVASSTAIGPQYLTVTVMDDGGNVSTVPFTLIVGGTAEIWNGSGPDNTWGDAANWVGGMAPGVNDLITLAGTAQTTSELQTNYSVGSLTFGSGAGSFNLINAGTSLTLNGSVTNNSTNPQTLSVPVVLGGALTFDAASNNLVFGDPISGAGVVSITGSGTNVFLAANSYQGSTMVAGGSTLQLANTNALSESGLTLSNGASLQLRADISGGFTMTNLALANGSDTLNLDVNSLSGAAGQTLSLTNPLIFLASADQTINLTGNSTYVISLGAIALTASSHTPYFNLNLNTQPAGPALVVAAVTSGIWGEDLDLNGGGKVTITGNLSNTPAGSGDLNLFINNGTLLTLQGMTVKTNSGDAFKYMVANGTLVLDNSHALTNDTTGTGLNQSWFVLGAATNYFSGSGFSHEAGVLTATNNSFNAAISLGDANYPNGGITNSALNTNYVSDGDIGFTNSGMFTIGGQNTSGTNTYANPIILGWTTNRGKSVTLVAATGGTVNFTGSLLANGADTSAGVTVGDPVHGGVVELAGTNTYGGPTTVSNGTLLVSGAVGSGGVTVVNGATLGGSGAIAGAVTIQAGGNLIPGYGATEAGTILNLPAGALTLTPGSTTTLAVRHAGSNNDQIVCAAVNYGGTLSVVTNVGDAPFAAGDAFQLFKAPSATNYTGYFGATRLPTLGFGLLWSNNLAANGSLLVVASPPTAGFTNTPANLFVTQSERFTDASTGTITNWIWNFGDGNTVTNFSNASVSHAYAAAGTYSASLTVTGPGGMSTSTQSGDVVVKPEVSLGGMSRAANGALVFTGTNGPAGLSYRIVASTNLTMAAANWTPVATNTFAGDGSFGYTNWSRTNGTYFLRLVSP